MSMKAACVTLVSDAKAEEAAVSWAGRGRRMPRASRPDSIQENRPFSAARPEEMKRRGREKRERERKYDITQTHAPTAAEAAAVAGCYFLLPP